MERRQWTTLLVALVVLGVVGSVAAPALPGEATGPTRGADGATAVHGNHVTATSQVVGDGRIYVESLFIVREGYVVVHANAGGDPGKVLGVRPVSLGYHESLSVAVEGLPADGPGKVWVVLHGDDGDGTFESGDDEVLSSFGSVAGVAIQVRTGPASARVGVPSARGKRTDRTLTVDRVDLPAAGYVVVRRANGTRPGEVVGYTPLEAGTHRNVTVELDRSFYASMPERFAMYATLYRDDGDGEFDPAADRRITVGGEDVTTQFGVSKAAGGTAGTTTTPLVNTPSVTRTSTTRRPPPGTTATTTDGGAATSMPGFGVTLAVAALALAGPLARRRRG